MAFFAPIFRTDGFETTGYWEICHRLGSREPLDAALTAGEVAAHVQAEGEDPRQFYKIPQEHWGDPSAFLEGEPGERLFCWGSSDVPIKLQNRPIAFFQQEVDAWLRGLRREPLGTVAGSTGFSEDAAALEDCLARATVPTEGYWSIFATLAWIVSRRDRFVAGTQCFESQRHADRGVFCGYAWIALGNKAGELFGQTFSDAERDLREAVESNRLRGGTAVDIRSDLSVAIERHQWRSWQRAFETKWGTVVIPGYHNFAWPSDMVRAAFPSSDLEQGSSPKPALPKSAKPKHRKYEAVAHRAAAIIRAKQCLRSVAIREAIGELGADAAVQPESAERGARETFDLIYRQDGIPHQN